MTKPLLMRRLLLLIAICTFCSNVNAQPPAMEEKLYYTCKVWGFVKYYHSEVSTCHTNWDSVLLAVLPDIRSAANSTEFNDAILDMLNAAGPMALSTTYFPDTLPPELKRNRDFGWIGSSVLRPDVRIILDTIKNNFRPHAGCYVEVPASPSYNPANPAGGYLKFPYDSMMLPVTMALTFPDQDHRLLQLFKFWNIVRYFNPYNYVLDVPWDTTLMHYGVPISSSANALSLHMLYEKITATLDDAHVEGFTRNNYYWKPPGYYRPQLRLSYMDGKYVVVRSGETGIVPGDAIISVDGLTGTQWEDSLRQYLSVGNESVFRREMSSQMLCRMTSGIGESIVLEDSTGASHSVTVTTKSPAVFPSSFWDYVYFTDSLKDIQFTTMPCDIGYVNMANVEDDVTVANAYSALKSKEAIIFDFRNEAYTADIFAQLMYPHPMEHAKLTVPDPEYPGTYYWDHQVLGSGSGAEPYTGKVILLIGPGAQSHIEWHCMALEAMPDVVKIGDRTAGADGVITFLSLSQDQRFGWTSMGVYYPNGDSTQKIGLVPDTFTYQTRVSLRRNRDDVLEKALQVAGCNVGIPGNAPAPGSVHIHPNPATDILNIDIANASQGYIAISVNDISGREVIHHVAGGKEASVSIDIRSLQPGMYFTTVRTDSGQFVGKFIKQ